jgi:hypothetical protein
LADAFNNNFVEFQDDPIILKLEYRSSFWEILAFHFAWMWARSKNISLFACTFWIYAWD